MAITDFQSRNLCALETSLQGQLRFWGVSSLRNRHRQWGQSGVSMLDSPVTITLETSDVLNQTNAT